LLALQDALYIKDDNIIKAATGLAGGVGGMNDTGGSLLGASMMLGLAHGRSLDEMENLDKLYSCVMQVGKLYKWFEKEFGSAKCREICTRFAGGTFYDIQIPWQAELANEAKLPEKCATLSAKVAAKTVEMLWDSLQPEK
jgi:hypothetical protein